MRNILHSFLRIILLSAILMVPTLVNSLQAQGLSKIEQAFASGDVQTIGENLSSKVEYSLLTKTDILHATQVVERLEEFFEKYPPINYSRKHEGNAKNSESKYVIGILKTETRSFRLYLYFENSAEKQKVKEIRLDNPR